MREIELISKGLKAFVDDNDYEFLMQFKWYKRPSKYTVYAHAKIDGKYIRMHNLLMGRLWIDHIDHNGLNNQRSNLRLCTHGENMKNKRPYGKTSQYKGVVKFRNGWRSQFWLNGKLKHIGCFKTEDEAGKAYNEAIKKYGNEFNYKNKVPD